MTHFLIKTRKRLWDDCPWLASEDVQADALTGFRTSDNALSVWTVANDGSNLHRIVAALAANCTSISNLDYALLAQQDVTDLNIDIEETPGETLDQQANGQWHRELVRLSGTKLLNLARRIRAQGKVKRIPEKRIKRLTEDTVGNGNIERDKLCHGISARISR